MVELSCLYDVDIDVLQRLLPFFRRAINITRIEPVCGKKPSVSYANREGEPTTFCELSNTFDN
jgi:hypothetical protein